MLISALFTFVLSILKALLSLQQSLSFLLLLKLSNALVANYLRIQYFLQCHGFLLTHAYTWHNKTSKNNYNKERYLI